MKKQEKVIFELRRIAANHGGILRPEDVVKEAKSKSSVLHDQFEWNDGHAAHQYRIWQARHMISISVEYVQADHKQIMMRCFVSLTPDRKNPGGGYREMVTVMANQDSYSQMLEDAFRDMHIFQTKYKKIKEVAPVITAIKKTSQKKR